MIIIVHFHFFSFAIAFMCIPIISCILLQTAIGNRLNGLVLGVINDEDVNSNCFNASLQTVKVRRLECIMQLLSCRFIDQFDPNILELVRIFSTLLSIFKESFRFRNSTGLRKKLIPMLKDLKSTDISKSIRTSRLFMLRGEGRMS
jgi:hypothetical protein